MKKWFKENYHQSRFYLHQESSELSVFSVLVDHFLWPQNIADHASSHSRLFSVFFFLNRGNFKEIFVVIYVYLFAVTSLRTYFTTALLHFLNVL